MNSEFLLSLINYQIRSIVNENRYVVRSSSIRIIHYDFLKEEFSGKKPSVLCACYESGAVPGIYAYIAILLSCSALFLYDDWISEKYRLLYDNSTDEPLYKRTQRYFRNALGDDIVNVLTHRLMDCISDLLLKIDLKVDEFLERLKGSNERKLDERGSMVEEQSELDRTSDKVSGEAIGIDEHRSYFWLLSQLRVYLLAYSSFVRLLFSHCRMCSAVTAFPQGCMIAQPHRIFGIISLICRSKSIEMRTFSRVPLPSKRRVGELRRSQSQL